jgi:transcription termination factor NusB
MATRKQMREAIFGKLMSLLAKGEKPSKDVEKKINSDPELKKLYAKAEKSAAEARKSAEKLSKKYGF